MKTHKSSITEWPIKQTEHRVKAPETSFPAGWSSRETTELAKTCSTQNLGRDILLFTYKLELACEKDVACLTRSKEVMTAAACDGSTLRSLGHDPFCHSTHSRFILVITIGSENT